MADRYPLNCWTNRCRHHETAGSPECCKAGVRYADLVPELFGRALRLPCFVHERSEDVVTCDKLSRYTLEEAEAIERELDDAIRLYAAGKSPCCEAELVRRANVAFCGKCRAFVARECGDKDVCGGDDE